MNQSRLAYCTEIDCGKLSPCLGEIVAVGDQRVKSNSEFVFVNNWQAETPHDSGLLNDFVILASGKEHVKDITIRQRPC